MDRSKDILKRDTVPLLGYQIIEIVDSTELEFPRNLLLGKGKAMALVLSIGGVCHRMRLPTVQQLVRPQFRRAQGPDND